MADGVIYSSNLTRPLAPFALTLRPPLQGGFGPQGITMAPLWKQRQKDKCATVNKITPSSAERRRVTAAQKMNLAEHEDPVNAHVDALTPPWARTPKELKEQQSDDDEDDPKSTVNLVAELQRLNCPAISDPAKKVREFHERLTEISAHAKSQTPCLCIPAAF
jgi:hypothetical protein